jgi:dUTP pyrophosphatase
MNFNADEAREKLFQAIDPKNPYSLDDFNEEFSNISHTAREFNQNSERYKIDVNFVNKSDNPNPEYAHEGDSGFDIRANLENPIIIKSGKRHLIPTGLYFELPPNVELQIRSRSGLALRSGIAVLNSPGTVDNCYRGEIGVILINHGEDEFLVKHGDRIAQGVLAYVSANNFMKLNEVTEISDNTTRSTNGYGSSGIR